MDHRWLKRYACVLIGAGFFVAVTAATGWYMLACTQAVPMLLVRWKIVKIFEKYGYSVFWERAARDKLHPYLKADVVSLYDQKHRMPFDPAVFANISPSALIHVMEVIDSPDRIPVYLFLFEDPVPNDTRDLRSFVKSRGTLPYIEHYHSPVPSYFIGRLMAWGDLATFPLEYGFSFPELLARRSWVSNARTRILRWCLAPGIVAILAGFFLHAYVIPPRCVKRAGIYARRARKILCFWERASLPEVSVSLEQPHAKGRAFPGQAAFLVGHDRRKDSFVAERERKEQEALLFSLEELCAGAVGSVRAELQALLSQFPGMKRVRIRKARMLFERATAICLEPERPKFPETRVPPRVGKPGSCPTRRVFAAQSDQGKGHPEKKENAALSMPWLYGLFDRIVPSIEDMGGDPLVVITILLYSFLRPGCRELIIQDNYRDTVTLYERAKAKSNDIFRLFGRLISPEDIREGFEFLRKGGIIMERKRRSSPVCYSLNPHEREALSLPYACIIHGVMRAAHEIQKAGGEGS